MVIILVVMYMLLNREDKRDEKRTENAKQLAAERQTSAKELEQMRQKHEIEINTMWASAIKNLVDSQQATAKTIAEALDDHEKASQERYAKMSITKDLFEAAKERLKK